MIDKIKFFWKKLQKKTNEATTSSSGLQPDGSFVLTTGLESFMISTQDKTTGIKDEQSIRAKSPQDAKEMFLKTNTDKNVVVLGVTPINKLLEKAKTYKLSQDELIDFTDSLYTLMDSAIPLIDALGILYRETKSVTTLKLLVDMKKSIPINESMMEMPNSFPSDYVAIVSGAMLAERLAESLNEIGSFLGARKYIASQLNSALMAFLWPFLGIMCMLLGVSWYITPILIDIYSSFNAPLPFVTATLYGTLQFILAYFIFIIGFIVFALNTYNYFRATNYAFRYYSDEFLLDIPKIGKMYCLMEEFQFLKVFALLRSSGLATPDAFKLIIEAANNTVYKQMLSDVSDAYRNSREPENVFRQNKYVSEDIAQVYKIGVQVNALPEKFAQLANAKDAVAKKMVVNIKGTLNGATQITLGLLIAVMAMAFYFPILAISQIAQNGAH